MKTEGGLFSLEALLFKFLNSNSCVYLIENTILILIAGWELKFLKKVEGLLGFSATERMNLNETVMLYRMTQKSTPVWSSIEYTTEEESSKMKHVWTTNELT